MPIPSKTPCRRGIAPSSDSRHPSCAGPRGSSAGHRASRPCSSSRSGTPTRTRSPARVASRSSSRRCRRARSSRCSTALRGLVLTGGPDIDPCHYGEEPHPALGPVERQIDVFELALVRAALRRNMPVLGICRGMQLLNVALRRQPRPARRQAPPGRRRAHPVAHGAHRGAAAGSPGSSARRSCRSTPSTTRRSTGSARGLRAVALVGRRRHRGRRGRPAAVLPRRAVARREPRGQHRADAPARRLRRGGDAGRRAASAAPPELGRHRRARMSALRRHARPPAYEPGSALRRGVLGARRAAAALRVGAGPPRRARTSTPSARRPGRRRRVRMRLPRRRRLRRIRGRPGPAHHRRPPSGGRSRAGLEQRVRALDAFVARRLRRAARSSPRASSPPG